MKEKADLSGLNVMLCSSTASMRSNIDITDSTDKFTPDVKNGTNMK